MTENSTTVGEARPPENGLSLSEVQDTLVEPSETESPPDTPRYIEDDGFNHESPPVGEIQRDLDTLTYSGSTINDLEIQLTKTKHTYQKTLTESRKIVDNLRRRLNTHIKRSEPFIEIWRRARQVQEESNKAAMRFDKANSQHAASKEMIRMAESQLTPEKSEASGDSGSPSPLDQAWQEMLNHATLKVVETERERRLSELEHGAVLEKVRNVMEEYRATEKRLRTHIVKSRPYYEERFRANQRLQQLKQHTDDLEQKIRESKKQYTDTLKKLEQLNCEIHHRRARSQTIPSRVTPVGNIRQTFSTNSSPKMAHREIDTESLDSVMVPREFTGSVCSLPSVCASDVSDFSVTPSTNHSPELEEEAKAKEDAPVNQRSEGASPTNKSHDEKSFEEQLATKLVSSCIKAAVQNLEHSS